MDGPTERHLNRLLPRPRIRRRARDSLPTMASPTPPQGHPSWTSGLGPGRRMENITDPYLAKEIGQCRQRLTEIRSTYTTHEKIKKRWAAILYQSIDGSSLKNSHQVTGQHQWVADGTSLLSGRNINCHKVRIGALPTRSRMTRGRRGDKLCRRGAWRRKLTIMSCRFALAPTRPESTDMTPSSPT